MDMERVSSIPEPTDRALTMMLYLVRKQMFLDGNKRTSMLAGNHIMIANGCGIISVPVDHQPTFTKMLVEYYESNDMTDIKAFLYDNCIDGIEFSVQGQEGLEREASEVDLDDECER